MKLLFVSTRQAKPSFRFRVEKILPFFEEQGHACEVEFLPKSTFARMGLYHRMSRYDAVFLQKRLLSRSELYYVRQRARHLIYDVDDAVMFNGRGEEDQRRKTRFRNMVRAADLTLCGNRYLSRIAVGEGGRCVIVPTAIDTELYHPRLKAEQTQNSFDRITIGWTGSRSTNRYLNELFGVLSQLAGRVKLKILSDTQDDLEFDRLMDVPCSFVKWSPEVEISETATFDIGLMPLPENRWTRGKCGFKALQYMAMGIPAVCSPVGVNSEIITQGVNGFLPRTPEEWLGCLSELISSEELRARIGEAGRKRVEEGYSLRLQGGRTVDAVERVVGGGVVRRSA